LEYPVYAPPGHLLFVQESGVWALKFSLADGKPSGAPFLVATTGSRPTVADDGTVAMVTDERNTEHMQLSWVDRSGTLASPVGRVGRLLIGPRLSPNGRLVVGAAQGDGNVSLDLWVVDLDRHSERRLTYEPGINNSPEWSPDGKSIVYSCDAGVCARAADGTGQAVVVVAKPASVPAVSPDGRTLMFTREQAVTSQDIFIAPLGAGGVMTPAGSARPLIAAERMQHDIEVSPDGKYAAYVSNESGVNMVYVTEFPSARGKWQVGAGMLPRWNGKGDRLYIDVADRIMEVEVATVPSVSISEPHSLFSGQSVGIAIPGIGFQPSPDGSRFLVNRSTVAASNTAITIVQNWFAEFAAGARK
jgi:Tol biopolymer transport system component